MALLLALLVSACTYHGQSMSMDNPVTRRAAWFSFVGGSDIRSACAPGAPDRFRLIYNGFWYNQVRIYELGAGGPRQLDQRVLGPTELGGMSTNDLLAPWRGAKASVLLDPQRYERLLAALAASDFYGKPPVGLLLPSDGFYWTAVGCHGGKFTFNAWLYPDERFKRLVFPQELLAADATGVAYAPPDPMAYTTFFSRPQLEVERWYIKVLEDGLSGS